MKALWVTALCLLTIGCSTSSSAPVPAGVDASALAVSDAGTIQPPSPAASDTPFRKPRATRAALPQPVDARTPGQLAAAACNGRCKGTAIKPLLAATTGNPIIPPSWTVPAWYIDPANSIGCASDSNSGTSATCSGGCAGSVCTSGIGPLSTFGEFRAHRIGTTMPVYPFGQSVTVTLLSAQAAGQDKIVFEPHMTGGGQAVLLGTLVVVQPTFTAGTITQPTIAAGGTLLTVASMPAGTVANEIVYNVTRNSYAFIDSMNGTTATMQQPLKAAYVTVPGIPAASESAGEDQTWATGDSIEIEQVQAANLGYWTPQGADLTTGGAQASVGWVQFLQIVDTSGDVTSQYPLINNGAAANTLAMDVVSTRLALATTGGRGNGVNVLGCSVAGLAISTANTSLIYGGGYAAGMTIAGNNNQIQGKAILHGTFELAGSFSNIGDIYSNGAWIVAGGQLDMTNPVWGSFALEVYPQGTVWTTASFSADLLTSGAITWGSAGTTGSFYDAGAWTSGISITPANIDAHGGLQDPATGARFSYAN
jgi:hypothetical protein